MTQHLGVDFGATNLKWAVIEHRDEAWATLDRGQVPTLAAEGPDAVIGRIASIGATALARWPAIVTLGIGVPGLYDPVGGSTRFLMNMPGDWAGIPVAPPVEAALGIPVVAHQRRAGVRPRGAAPGRGPRSVVDGRADARHRRRRRHRDRRHGPPRSRRDGRRGRPPDARPRRPVVPAAGTGAVSRRSPGRTGSPRRAAPRRPRRRSSPPGRAMRAALAGLAQVGR